MSYGHHLFVNNNFYTLSKLGELFEPLILRLTRIHNIPEQCTLSDRIIRLRQIVDVHARTPEMEALIAELNDAEAAPKASLDKRPPSASTEVESADGENLDTELDEDVPVPAEGKKELCSIRSSGESVPRTPVTSCCV